jgi:hypothetical protein
MTTCIMWNISKVRNARIFQVIATLAFVVPWWPTMQSRLIWWIFCTVPDPWLPYFWPFPFPNPTVSALCERFVLFLRSGLRPHDLSNSEHNYIFSENCKRRPSSKEPFIFKIFNIVIWCFFKESVKKI